MTISQRDARTVAPSTDCGLERAIISRGHVNDRRLLAFRKSTPALLWGNYRSHDLGSPESHEHCFVYERSTGDQRLLVALNFSTRDQEISIPTLGTGKIVLSTLLDREEEVELAGFNLRANEGCIIVL